MEKTGMELKIKTLIIMLGITFDEIIIDLEVGEYKFDSIEWDRDLDEIFLHTFDEGLSIEYTFTSLTDDIQESIHNYLLKLAIH